MRTRRLILVIVALLLLSLALAACGGDGATATSPAAQAYLESAKTKDAKEVAARPAATTAAETASGAELAVAMASYSVADLAAMTQATASTEDGDVTGVSLKALLETAGISAETIVLTATDGYAAEIAMADIDDAAIIVLDDDGTFDSVIPTLAKDTWVKDLASIAAK
ncbi:MAG: hypothetical protein ACYCYF_01950 [Anaerolineae bacterium]